MRHVRLTCVNHPELRWMCKSIATSKDGGYNGLRNIFFLGHGDFFLGHGDDEPAKECECPAGDLILAPEETWDDECENA